MVGFDPLAPQILPLCVCVFQLARVDGLAWGDLPPLLPPASREEGCIHVFA